MNRDVRCAVFRPDDGRLADAVALLESLGADPVADPMLEVQPTGATPREAEFVVLTSSVAGGLLAEVDWDPGDATVVAIGPSTAEGLRQAGYAVDRVPGDYSSAGLVDALRDVVPGARVEVARSDHGSDVLLDGLNDAGAFVHETVLYELSRPEASGESTELAAAGDLDAACFTSSMTVEHFLAAAEDRGVRGAAVDGLNDAVVGTIGDPTRETAESHGISVDVVPEEADFRALATAVVERAAPTYHE